VTENISRRIIKAVRADLPSGTVTFLFTDVEGSTRLLHELGDHGYAQALAEHRRILRDAFARHGGVEVDTQGDAFFVAFPSARGALQAARDALRGLAATPLRVRVGIHTGTPRVTEEGYVGAEVHRAARIAAAGHGGQVLVSVATASLLEPAGLRELGEHRLKDFDEPVPLYQLGDESFPPLKTISNTNLPRPASSFVGREREVEEVASLLRGGARLLTLTGPGGSGKTRLALEAAAELVPALKAGVFWVGLAPLRKAALVAETIAQTLGAKDGLAEHIGEREMLLLLDNLEQVVEAAPEFAVLVETCPNLRLLVTSRELLRVRGELEYPVPPLAEPEAVELFCTRARMEPEDAVHALCRALDNLPLAIELAAARAPVLSPKQIVERLSGRLDLLKGGRDADPRQQTLRATIEWSFDLLEEDEKLLFARLAVFRGGCTLDAAEEVAGADLDTLQSLVDKSLLRHTGERFWMLETIREYAAERLEESAQRDELHRRHAEHFLAVAEEAYPNLRGGSQARDWLDRLEAEHDNFRAALDRLEATGDAQLALQLGGALYPFWYLRGHAPEGGRRLRRLLAVDERPTPARARALNGASVLVGTTGDTATERLFAEQGLALNRVLGDRWGAAYSTFLLGGNAASAADFERARPLLEEALERFREVGDDQYVLLVTDSLAWTYGELGDGERRRALHEEVLGQARAQSNELLVALQLDQLAIFAADEGNVDGALSMLKESLQISRDFSDRSAIADTLGYFAAVLVAAGRAEEAARLLASAQALHEEFGSSGAWPAKENEEALGRIRAQLEETAFAEAWAQGQALTVDEAVAFALDS
jgi:predicted ATPase/class 3 adenylate cyclase